MQHWNNLFERNIAVILICDMFLHIFFVTKSTTFLVRLFRNFHVGILSIMEAIL